MIIYILGIALLFMFFYFLGNYNNRNSKKKIADFIADFGLDFYKISDKNCSVKRLSRANQVEIKDTSYLFDKCTLYLFDGFVLIQGYKDDFFKSSTRTFVIASDAEKTKNRFYDWTFLEPKLLEINQTQLKIVYTVKANNSDYPLLVSGLNPEDHKYVHQIKNYC